MVDAVSTITLQNNAPRPSPQNATVLNSRGSAQGASPEFVSSYIRVDNLQNVAILEYRSSETGEVVQQYPTQSQIEAFKHAQELRNKGQPAPQAAADPVEAPETRSAPSPAALKTPVVQSASALAPAPAAPSASTVSADTGTSVLA